MEYRCGYLKVAAITPRIRVADVEFNKNQIVTLMKRASGVEADIQVFPQLCITGATCQELFWQDSLLEGALEALDGIVKESAGHSGLVFVGLPIRYKSRVYNATAAIAGGKLLGIIPERNPSPIDETQGAHYFERGFETPVRMTVNGAVVPFGCNLIFEDCQSGARIACETGGDFWTGDDLSLGLAEAGALILANPTASCYSVGRSDYRQLMMKANSGKYICGYVCSNAGDGESTQDMVFAGERLVGENGALISRGAPFTLGITYGEIDTELIVAERSRRGFRAYSEAELEERYSIVQYNGGLREAIKGIGEMLRESLDKLDNKETKQPILRKYPRNPFVPENEAERTARCEEILTVQALALKKRLSHINARSAVIGISGGLDSTLALIVAARAFDLMKLPREGIIAVTMPGFGTTDRTYDNACTLARTMGLTLREISIAEAVRGHFKDIGQDEGKRDVTYENAQARERTQILMDIANMENALMIGTGDMSELALGWATYSGDHMSMYGVNGAVPKTLVRHIVRTYATACGESSEESMKTLAKALFDILDTPVSPELLPPEDGKISQKTEDLVGPYELHDFFLYYMLRYGFSPKRLYTMAVSSFEGIYEPDVIKHWLVRFLARFFSQHYKRTCLPDGPKIGSVGISPRNGFRMPTDVCGTLWIKEAESL